MTNFKWSAHFLIWHHKNKCKNKNSQNFILFCEPIQFKIFYFLDVMSISFFKNYFSRKYQENFSQNNINP